MDLDAACTKKTCLADNIVTSIMTQEGWRKNPMPVTGQIKS